MVKIKNCAVQVKGMRFVTFWFRRYEEIVLERRLRAMCGVVEWIEHPLLMLPVRGSNPIPFLKIPFFLHAKRLFGDMRTFDLGYTRGSRLGQ